MLLAGVSQSGAFRELVRRKKHEIFVLSGMGSMSQHYTESATALSDYYYYDDDDDDDDDDDELNNRNVGPILFINLCIFCNFFVLNITGKLFWT